jgi:hypothetical protein
MLVGRGTFFELWSQENFDHLLEQEIYFDHDAFCRSQALFYRTYDNHIPFRHHDSVSGPDRIVV